MNYLTYGVSYNQMSEILYNQLAIGDHYVWRHGRLSYLHVVFRGRLYGFMEHTACWIRGKIGFIQRRENNNTHFLSAYALLMFGEASLGLLEVWCISIQTVVVFHCSCYFSVSYKVA